VVRLRSFSPADFARLIEAIDTPRLLVQWGGPLQFRFPLNEAQLSEYLTLGEGEPPRARIFTALDEQGRPVGHIELGFIDYKNAAAVVCRVLVFPEARRRGVCTPMIGRLLALAFGEMDLRRVELRVYSFNTPAIRCYERAGFTREGLLRQAQRVGDELWDLVVMGILRQEWQARIDQGG
jgi:RimJ/RimL family protein N-acetyltransferase